MAKLKAHGPERARFTRETDDGTNRYFLSVRADGAILSKHHTWIPASTYQAAQWHNYQWKLHSKPGTAKPLEDIRGILASKGWSEVSA